MLEIKIRKIVWILAVIAIGTGAMLAYKVHQKNWAYNHPLSDSVWGFQYYVPQKLPRGIHITDSRISVFEEANTIYSVGAELNFRTEDWVYSIREYRSGGAPEVTKLRDFNTDSILPTCMQRTTEAGQGYRLCHWLDYGRISVYEIKFAKGDTYFDSQFPAKKSQVIPMSELDAYVDSFKKADPPKQIIRGI
jgi:hypothetical protein